MHFSVWGPICSYLHGELYEELYERLYNIRYFLLPCRMTMHFSTSSHVVWSSCVSWTACANPTSAVALFYYRKKVTR
jgi:hypothetical protein